MINTFSSQIRCQDNNFVIFNDFHNIFKRCIFEKDTRVCVFIESPKRQEAFMDCILDTYYQTHGSSIKEVDYTNNRHQDFCIKFKNGSHIEIISNIDNARSFDIFIDGSASPWQRFSPEYINELALKKNNSRDAEEISVDDSLDDFLNEFKIIK